MSHSLSSFLDGKIIRHKPTDISKSDENFLKDFSMSFYYKIINTNDINTIENSLSEWIKYIGNNTETILSLMQNHEPHFSSIIGFFYQHGIGCNVDRNKALELYSLAAINNSDEDSLIQNLTNLHLLEEMNK